MRAPSDHDARLTARLREVSPDLLRYLRRRSPSEEDAADLLADCLLIAWRRRSAIPDDDEGARMWMFGVAVNALRNGARGRRRRQAVADRLREHLLTQTRPPELDGVRAAIDRLPRDQVDLVTLVHWEGFSVVEAGTVLGITESTARGRYQRARANLMRDPEIATLRRPEPSRSDPVETERPRDASPRQPASG